MNVFFYGLFMDKDLLAGKGITPSNVRSAVLDGYGLRIGERATLLPKEGARSYGVMMHIAQDEAALLYSAPSVADYVAEPVTLELEDGTRAEATCYNLPAERVTGTNAAYAEKLHALAGKLGFPKEYLEQIK